MTADQLTCAQVDEADLDLRYLTGKLSAQEADAFEDHLATCERCWALAEQGANVRAAQLPDGTAEPARSVRTLPRPYLRWAVMALAAGLAVVALGVWQLGPKAPADELRGDADTLLVRLAPVTSALQVTWSPVDEASRYRVRLHRPDGGLLLEHETGDTSFAVPRDSLRLDSRETGLFWLVEALSPTGAVLARSGLVPQPLLHPVP